MDFAGFKKYKFKQSFQRDLNAGYIKPTHICFIAETGELWTNGDFYPKLPKATQNTLGIVMGGSNISIGADGSINWTGQIKTITYWVANIVWGNSSVGSTIAVPEALLKKAAGTGTIPTEGDIVVTNDGYQYVISGKDDTGRIFGIVVTVPPASAVWSNIVGALSNNQYIPATKADGSNNVNLIGLDSSDTVQIGAPEQPINIKTSDKLRVNNEAVVLLGDLNLVKDGLTQEITGIKNQVDGITTDYDTKITDEQTAREQEDYRIKELLTLEVVDRGAADLELSNKIADLIDDGNPSYSKTFSSQKVTNQIIQVYHTIPDVQTYDELPSESTLQTPSICYVITEKTQYINSKSGSGWHASAGDFITIEDLMKYLKDTGYIKGSDLVDNVTTGDSNKALSASMGKWLNDNKLSATTTVNNLISSDIKNPLSANMGKWLNENKLGTADVINNLTSTLTSKPLAAAQGKVLNDSILTIKTYFNGTKAKNAILADSALTANKLSATKRITVKLDGTITGTGYIDTDFSGNPTINITTKGGDTTSTLQQQTTSWYHYNKLNTIACLCRFKQPQQVNLHIQFFDNFQGNYTFIFAQRDGNPETSAVGHCAFKAPAFSVSHFPTNARICVYGKSDGYIYVYMCGTAPYHICGFTTTLTTEGGGNLEVLPLGNGTVVSAADLAKDITYTYMNSFNVYQLVNDGSNNFLERKETIRNGYVAPV